MGLCRSNLILKHFLAQLVFQMTVRMATCKELAEDPDSIDRLAKHYWDLEKSATPVHLLLPWFPGTAKRQNKTSTTNLYNLINSYVQLRRNSPVPSMDAIDLLIAHGDTDTTIIGVSINILLAFKFKFTYCLSGHLGDNFRRCH